MLTEKYARDREELPKADETLRDAVWNRLGGGGIALPGAVTSIAALVMSEKAKVSDKVEYFRFCFQFDSVSCSAGLLLFFGVLVLNVLWIGAVLFPYLDGPKHVTMPRRIYLIGAIVGISAYVWFVVWLLLD
ncbi:MAG: hypothetical protein Q8L22_21265 [Reyranella sp.]|nr:hypothetical protein [Reyranella sp.]